MPEKSIHDAILAEPKGEPVSGEVKVTLRQKGRLLEITVPEDKAWLYYMLDEQQKALNSISSNVTIMLVLIVLAAIATFIGMF
jgi:hypothetical protein